MLVFFKNQSQKTGKTRESSSSGVFVFFFRERDFSLEYRQIRTSEFVRARRKAALRGEVYAWTLVLRVFDKLLEVGVSPYLGFILALNTFSMFELNEAVRGRLIGPKTWDRIVVIFLDFFNWS